MQQISFSKQQQQLRNCENAVWASLTSVCGGPAVGLCQSIDDAVDLFCAFMQSSASSRRVLYKVLPDQIVDLTFLGCYDVDERNCDEKFPLGPIRVIVTSANWSFVCYSNVCCWPSYEENSCSMCYIQRDVSVYLWMLWHSVR